MSITETVKSIAEEARWSIQEWNGMIKIDADSQNGTWQTFCKILEEEKRFCYYSLCPVNAPKEKIPYMAEVLTRINYGLKVGNFEMDYETGEIHFKTYVDFFGEEDEKPALAQCIYANIMSFDNYFPKLLQAIHGGEEGKEEFSKTL